MRKKNYDYFEAFGVCADYACEAARFLDSTIRHYHPNTFPEEMKKMHRIENDADDKKHEIMENLAHEFLPPIELEDIVSIAQELDNVIDAIDDVMRKVYMFNVHCDSGDCILPETLAFTELITACTVSMKQLIKKFPQFKKSNDLLTDIVEINRIETEGDALHLTSLHDLYAAPSDPVHVMKWTQIYEALEECLDACENVSDIVEGVIMKNT